MTDRSIPPAHDEVQIFIDPDGTVTICDLWEALAPVAQALGEVAPACPVAPGAPGPPAGEEPGSPARDPSCRG